MESRVTLKMAVVVAFRSANFSRVEQQAKEDSKEECGAGEEADEAER